jgi:succinate dehydrogenase/fumarate reductase flavoprotein subunit
MTVWNEQFDVICVGFGFAGAAAAITAHDAGARVLLLEKMRDPGGISICSAGGVRISRDADASFAYLKSTNGGTTPESLLKHLAQKMSAVSEFIHELAKINNAEMLTTWVKANYPFDGGDSFGFVSIKDIPGYNPEKDFDWGKGLRGGTRLFKVMQDNVTARNIEVRLLTAADELISENGRVVGLIAKGKQIQAKGGVILTCGGFEADTKMQAQFWQEKPVLPGAFLGNTGDGVRMAQAVGADLWHMWHYHGTYGLRHPDPATFPFGIRLHRLPDWVPGKNGAEAEVQSFLAGDNDTLMPWIVVDQRGQRYMNEYPPYLQDTGHRPMATFDPVTQTYPRIPSWLILDDDGFSRGPIGFPTYNDRSTTFLWSNDNQAEIETGILHQAETIGEVAKVMGCKENMLMETIVRWNKFCQTGDDKDHSRLSDTMMPIVKPPFTFGQLWPLCANTQGGPVHDERQRILTPAKKVIPGLYAAGEMGSLFGHLYLSGGNLAECFIGGQQAGIEAASRT